MRIRIDVEVPAAAGGVEIQSRPCPPSSRLEPRSLVQHPEGGETTFAKQINGRWYICARGNAGGARHVFVRVYAQGGVSDPPPAAPPLDLDTVWTRPDIYNGDWEIPLVPIPGTPPCTQDLVAWADDGSYTPIAHPIRFDVESATDTYCGFYPSSSLFRLPPRRDWSRMPDHWRFKLEGCSNRGCENCDCLNGEWAVARDKQPGTLRWYQALGCSFAEREQSAFWRLLFNDRDGWWYLDCVGSPEQLPGTWISYRLHERAWDPSGPNTMSLVTDSGYCHVPSTVTLYPA
jgi:hypothetical protein